MKYIAHRGNLDGPNPLEENNPNYIKNTLQLGYDVEIDVWYTDNFYLGHDIPQYLVSEDFFLHPNIWCHAKNIEALDRLIKMGAHCFWHENDKYTLTSHGIIWAYPGSQLTKNTVCVMPEWSGLKDIKDVYGVCSDYILKIKSL